jgi:hypothetical protein
MDDARNLTNSPQRASARGSGQQHDILITTPVRRLLVALQGARNGIRDGREHTIASRTTVCQVELRQSIDV